MNSFEKLVELFEDFPGIGGRQAKRFAYYLLSKNHSYLENLAALVTSVKKDIAKCPSCMRFFGKIGIETHCRECSDRSRDASLLLIVSKDADLSAIEKSGLYTGYYFVLGGIIPILEKNPEARIRSVDLVRIVAERTKAGLREIIFALSATQEGEHTREFIEHLLEEYKTKGIKFSELGRGLSTGTELEYADPETIKAALQNKR